MNNDVTSVVRNDTITEKIFRLRLSEVEVSIIDKALREYFWKMLGGFPLDTAEKELAFRTYYRFRWIADRKERHFHRPRRQQYHKEIVEEFGGNLKEQGSG